ncbi:MULTISPECIES: hypothetical protein [Streptomyces]|uniref:Uncharacterized protein n=1 Tax=Streptomyces lateritius TaxID=67313 RepID=A0ABW6YH55_9ACTN|nr:MULTISPECIES: hypothetical protein [Streptomyces]QGZ48822.1 hypothetical protein GPZ77_10920 [Streptomyces sp. QHH-9511]GGU08308.1 hypothetical protein GCM10010272_62000 [Streptomyces lateritius]
MSDPQSVNNYDGPVFNGPASRNQFAWNNETVTQNQQNNSPVAPGYEALAALVADLLRQLPQAGLPDEQREDAEVAAGEVMATITRPEPPEEGRLRRALAALRGALAPVATGVVAGTTVGAQEWALRAIEGLTGAV